MSQDTSNRSFDELARGLADGSVTRGKALRLMGAALVGGTLASFPGVAWAAKGGKSSCAKFCQSLFGANTPQEAQCVSQGTKGQGPCFTCTTQTGCGPNFTKPTCTEVTGQTYNCSTCQCECPSGEVLCNGGCVSTSCSQGQVFDPSSCACVAVCVSNGGSCNADTECCSGTICPNGKCCTPNQSQTNPSHCTADTQCCSGTCGFQGPGINSGCVPCRDAGAPCNADTQCCRNSSNGGTCVNGRCCAAAGQSCNDTKPCCPGHGCDRGTCN